MTVKTMVGPPGHQQCVVGPGEAGPGREEMSMAVLNEERIGRVDVWDLHHFRAPIQRIVARRAIDRLELTSYVHGLLATGRWDVVRTVPHIDADGRRSDHVYDLYGRSWGASL
jgi:hypothetical protein